MKVFFNRCFPPGRFVALNFFGMLFVRRGTVVTPALLNHEAIHSAQMRELLYVPFYVIYVTEWLWRVMKNRGKSYRSYRDLSFEREAYLYGDDMSYLRRRKPFAQWRCHSQRQ